MTNAIKYSSLNSTIKIISKLLGDDFIKINVIDNGPGISENAKDQIFEKFTQLISQNSGLTRSTGLGLAFCKMAVEAHQGKIGVEPNEEGGAIFWFTIPLLKAIESTEKENDENLIGKIRISEDNYNKLLPFLVELKQTAIYEIAEIRHITNTIKALGIPNIDGIINAIENSSYSVNEENYLKLIEEIEGLTK